MTVSAPPVVSVPIPVNNKWVGTGRKKLAVVLHVAQCDTLSELDNYFTNPANGQASSNYGIGPDGSIHCYVDPSGSDAPYANGLVLGPDASAQKLIAAAGVGVNLNDVTISIEHVGRSSYNELTATGTPFVLSAAQLAASTALSAWLFETFGIPFSEDTLLGHYEIYTPHAGCPGFDFNGFQVYEASVTALFSPTPPDPCADVRTQLATALAGLTEADALAASQGAKLIAVRNALG